MEDTFCCVSDRSVLCYYMASLKNTAATSYDNPIILQKDETKRKKGNGNRENWLKRWIREMEGDSPVSDWPRLGEGNIASHAFDGGIFTSAIWCCTINPCFTHEGAICTCTKAGSGTSRWQMSELGWLTGQMWWGHTAVNSGWTVYEIHSSGFLDHRSVPAFAWPH